MVLRDSTRNDLMPLTSLKKLLTGGGIDANKHPVLCGPWEGFLDGVNLPATTDGHSGLFVSPRALIPAVKLFPSKMHSAAPHRICSRAYRHNSSRCLPVVPSQHSTTGFN